MLVVGCGNYNTTPLKINSYETYKRRQPTKGCYYYYFKIVSWLGVLSLSFYCIMFNASVHHHFIKCLLYSATLLFIFLRNTNYAPTCGHKEVPKLNMSTKYCKVWRPLLCKVSLVPIWKCHPMAMKLHDKSNRIILPRFSTLMHMYNHNFRISGLAVNLYERLRYIGYTMPATILYSFSRIGLAAFYHSDQDIRHLF